jgi:hypothetical protein
MDIAVGFYFVVLVLAQGGKTLGFATASPIPLSPTAL